MPTPKLPASVATASGNSPVVDTATLDAVLARLDDYCGSPKAGFNALVAHRGLCANPKVAAALTECAICVGRLDVAASALPLAEDPSGRLKAQLHMARGAPFAALMALTAAAADRPDGRAMALRIRANIALDRYDAAAAAVEAWSRTVPNSRTPFKVMAKTLAEHDDPRSMDWSARADAMPDRKAALSHAH